MEDLRFTTSANAGHASAIAALAANPVKVDRKLLGRIGFLLSRTSWRRRRFASCPALLARAGRLSSLLAILLSLPFSVIHETDRNRHPGDLAGQSFRERKRRCSGGARP
jgi:hypothetical protein